MKYLAIEKELVKYSGSDYSEILKSEAQMVWEYQKKGIIREIYFRTDVKCAIIILECSTINEAQKVLAELPLVKKQMINFEVYELSPYTGYDRLIK